MSSKNGNAVETKGAPKTPESKPAAKSGKGARKSKAPESYDRSGRSATGLKGAGERNPLGRRIGTGAHFMCVALAEAGAEGAKPAALLERIAELCAKHGVKCRGSIGNQLNSGKLERVFTDEAPGGWALSALGAKLWRSGKPGRRSELRTAGAKSVK